MPEIKTYERVVEARHAIKVDAIEVLPGRFAFRYNEEVTRTGAKPRHEKRQGIASAGQLKNLRAGKGKDSFEGFMGHTDADVDAIRRFGYLAISHDNYSFAKRVVPAFDWIEHGGSPDNLLRFDSWDHSFWSLDGSLFPSAIYFGYIDARIDNRTYDLEKLVEILQKRDDVTILAASEEWDSRVRQLRYKKHTLDDLVALPGEEIDQIPGYNRDGGRTHTVTFMWTPTSEQHAIIRERRPQYKGMKQVRAGDDKYKIIFDEDWLGLRAGGAARFGDFYDQTLPDGTDVRKAHEAFGLEEDYD